MSSESPGWFPQEKRKPKMKNTSKFLVVAIAMKIKVKYQKASLDGI